MNDTLILALIGLIGFAASLLTVSQIKLWRQHKRLQQDYESLRSQIQRSSDDVAGLCSAAIAVDKRLSVNESQLSQLLNVGYMSQQSLSRQQEQIANESNEEEPQGYALAIEKIQRGVNIDELVKSCGLTRDEAVLLMRLHGKK
jgi:septal ring factor EnvC (AmiA/AmiB activator)